MLGIIGAMESEVTGLKNEMKNQKVTTVAGMDFFEGQINDKDVVVVKCGIGKVNAAMCTQILADKFNIDAVVNTGVAGALNNDVNICDIVISTDAVEHDMNVEPLGYKQGQIPDMDISEFPSDEKMIKLGMESIKDANVDVNVFTGRVVSGDLFVASKKTKDYLVDNFDGYCAEMEGAAIAHAAYLNSIPFLIIRSISDKADGSAHMDYPEFEKKAANNSIEILRQIIKNY